MSTNPLLRRCGVLALEILLVVVALSVAYELPGRVGEFWFEHALKTGMTKNQVMIDWTAMGTDTGPTDEGPHSLGFSFIDFGTICFQTGRHFSVQFDDKERVKTWSMNRWTKIC